MIARWSWNALRRDWKAGELRLIAAALIIAVAASTTVGFFTDRVNRALNTQAGELLGADLALVSSSAIPDEVRAQAEDIGLDTAATLTFRSAGSTDDALEMADLKAVESPYPLRGRLRVADVMFADEREVDTVPAPGEAWLDSRLLQRLGIDTGDQVSFGAVTFNVTQVLTYEPDRGGDLLNIAPRAMINLEDIPATQLVQPGSRLTHRLLLRGDMAQLEAIRTWVRNADIDGLRIEDIREGRPELRTALERADQFLGLAALVSVALAGLAVALAARRYTLRHLDHCAILRCFGATQKFVLQAFTLQLLWLGLIAGAIGVIIGWFGQMGLVTLLSTLVAGELPPPTLLPVFIGLSVALVTLLGFALPQIQRLRSVPPGRVLRRDLGPLPARTWTVYGAAILALMVLLPWQSGDLQMSLNTIAGLLITAAVLAGSAWIMIRILSRLRSKVGVAWRFGLANVSRRAAGSAAQVLGIGLGLTLMLVLTLVRTDLLDGWYERVPDDAPNYFLINVQPDEARGVEQFLQERAGIEARLYPMVRGRLAQINGKDVVPEDFPDGRPRRLMTREFNLSWAATMAPDNRLVRGNWWNADERNHQNWISVEEEIADIMGVGIGDEVTFSIAGNTATATIKNLRWVEWDSFNVNFFVVASPGVLDDHPATYITSFYLPPEQRSLLNDIVRAFPSATVLDVDALLTQIRRIMDQVALTVEYVFLFTLLAGLIVLLAALQSTHDERRYETALLAALGAKRAQIIRGLAAEFTVIGLVAGTLAALAATLTGWLLASRVFKIPYEIDPQVWIYGLVGGIGLVLIAGLAGTWRVLQRSPMGVLR